jgi:hypothetical protein
MAAKINPTTLKWRHDGKYADGTPIAPEDFGRWEIELNGEHVFSIPVGWDQDGDYETPIADMDLKEGEYTLRMRLVTARGVESPWSSATHFVIGRVPAAPFDLAVE